MKLCAAFLWELTKDLLDFRRYLSPYIEASRSLIKNWQFSAFQAEFVRGKMPGGNKIFSPALNPLVVLFGTEIWFGRNKFSDHDFKHTQRGKSGSKFFPDTVEYGMLGTRSRQVAEYFTYHNLV